MRSPSAWAISGPEGGAYSGLLDLAPARIAKQGTVERGSCPFPGEHRPDRPDFGAGGSVTHYSRTDSRKGRPTGIMANNAHPEELAEELLEILRGAPYSGTSATAAEGRISAIRIKAEGANPGTIERDYLEKACATLKRALRQKGSMGERKRQWVREDIGKYRDSKGLSDEMQRQGVRVGTGP